MHNTLADGLAQRRVLTALTEELEMQHSLTRNITHTRPLSQLAVALVSLAAAATSASAGVFGVTTFSAGVTRCATGVNQSTNGAIIATNWVEIDYCSGWTEYIPMVQTGPNVAEAVGTYGAVYGAVLSSTQTEYKIVLHTAGDRIAAVRIMGSPNTKVGFDKASPNPGTAGSGTGFNVTTGTLTGAWTVYAHLTDQVAICPSVARRDLYASLHLRFSTCFNHGDYMSFRVDTDYVY